MSGDPNKHQNELTAKGDNFANERDLLQRGDAVIKALTSLTEDQRRELLNRALDDVDSGLKVS